MTISSRTTEGTPNRCPVCRQAVQIEPSQPFGDAPCPCCGNLLWFFVADGDVRWFDAHVTEQIAERLGISRDALRSGQFDELGVDSLDAVELVMELEEGSG